MRPRLNSRPRSATSSGTCSSNARRSRRQWRTATLAAVLVLTVAATTTVATWDTVRGRAARRAIGLTVPPRSTLYIATNGGITLVRGRTVNVVPYNPGTAGTIAASEDLGIRSMSSNPPWTTGAAFGLDGVPMLAPPVGANALCCWGDGTTDGRYNYAVRADSTLLEPIGSRPLAPPAVYRFRRDWSGPQLAFSLGSTGQYEGLTFSRTTNTFWTTKRLDGDAVIEEWSRDGAQLGTAVRLKGAVLPAIAADPADGTLWAVRPTPGGAKLENFDTTGRRLATVDVDTLLGTGAAEFAWVAPR